MKQNSTNQVELNTGSNIVNKIKYYNFLFFKNIFSEK